MLKTDSLSLKFFCEENAGFITNACVQKIQMPNRRELIFNLRNNGENKKLYININPKYPHICFVNAKKELQIPKTPPKFCMQLRKYLEGARIIKFNNVDYERILEFYFLITDEFGIETFLVLSVELMDKYSNIILYDKKTSLIIGCAHNVSKEKSSIREVYGGIKYIYPAKQNKFDILKISYSSFCNFEADFYYFTKGFLQFLNNKANNREELFSLMQNAVLDSKLIKEYWYKNCAFEKNAANSTFPDFNDIEMNDIYFEYFLKIVNVDLFELKKNNLQKKLNSRLKRVIGILNNKFNEDKFIIYKKSADLIIKYIYQITSGLEFITLEGQKIELNPNLMPAQNAENYYKLYSKLKSSKNILEKRKNEAEFEKKYLETIIFSLQNASSLSELIEIEDEISLLEVNGSNSKKTDKKTEVEHIFYNDVEILLGKNNKQNDFLIKKLSSPEDIWLHAAFAPSSHVIIKTQNGKVQIQDDVLLYAAKIVKENSPYKGLNKAQIIYTRRKFIKRPPDTPPGYVTYRGEKEIIV